MPSAWLRLALALAASAACQASPSPAGYPEVFAQLHRKKAAERQLEEARQAERKAQEPAVPAASTEAAGAAAGEERRLAAMQVELAVAGAGFAARAERPVAELRMEPWASELHTVAGAGARAPGLIYTIAIATALAVLVLFALLLYHNHWHTQQTVDEMKPEPNQARSLPSGGNEEGSGFSLGLLAMIGSSFLFSVVALLVRFLPSYGTFELVFWRSVFMSLGSMGTLYYRGVPFFGKPGTRGLLILRGVAGFGFMCGFYYSIKMMPLSDAVAITYTSPMITAVAAALVLGEAWDLIDAAGSVLCMAGVVMVSQPPFIMSLFGAEAEPLPLPGVLGAVVGALFSSSVYILLRYGKDLDPIVSVNYFAIAGIVISPLCEALFGEGWITPLRGDWLLLFLMAWLSMLGQALMNIGLSMESAGKATAMNYSQVVFAYVFQTLVLHEPMHAVSVLGACLIASWGGVALAKDARERRLVAQEAALKAPEAGAWETQVTQETAGSISRSASHCSAASSAWSLAEPADDCARAAAAAAPARSPRRSWGLPGA